MLNTSPIKYDLMDDKMCRLIEFINYLREREKNTEVSHAEVCEDYSKIIDEKDKMISELNSRIIQLEDENFKIESIVGRHEDLYNSLDMRIQGLKSDIDRMIHRKLEANVAATMYRTRYENLALRIRKVEEKIDNNCNVKVDLASLLKDFTQPVDTEDEDM